MGYIYQILNTENDKIYIGQTKNSVLSRFKAHLSEARNNRPGYLNEAIRKYGEDAFVVEIIEEIDDDSMNERERYWIAKLDANNREVGYNIHAGGNSGHITHPEHGRYRRVIKKYDLDGNFIKEYSSVKECAEDNQISTNAIIMCAQGKWKSWNNFQYKYDDDKPDVIKSKKGAKPVNQYTLDGVFVQTYPSALAAARAIGLGSSSHIGDCCNKKNGVKSSGGYYWEWA